MLIDFRVRGSEGKREGEKLHVREKHWSVASHMRPNTDWTCSWTCALPGSRSLQSLGSHSNHLNHTSQGIVYSFSSFLITNWLFIYHYLLIVPYMQVVISFICFLYQSYSLKQWFSICVLQEFLKYAIPDCLARGTDLFSLRCSNKKIQLPTQQQPSDMNESKSYLFFVRLKKYNIFLVYCRILVISLYVP